MAFSSIAKPTTSFSVVTKPTTTYTNLLAPAFRLLINSVDYLLINATDRLLINKPGTGTGYSNITKPT